MNDSSDQTKVLGPLAEQVNTLARRLASPPRPAPQAGASDASQAAPPPVALRVGLVLAGGGAKGAYELGVLDYLAEIGMRVDAIAGASIGALNGAVLAGEPSLFRGVQQLAGFWDRFATRSGVRPFSDAELPHDITGLVIEDTHRQMRRLVPRLRALRRNASLLELLIDEAVDFAGVRVGRPIWVTAYPLIDKRRLPTRLRLGLEVLRKLGGAQATLLRLNDYPEPVIREAVLASAALPFIFPARVVEDCAYIDGGLGGHGDKTPVRAFADQEHCDLIVVVHLHPEAIVTSPTTNHLTRVDIRPSVPINPPGPLGWLTSMLAFSPDRVQALRSLGYNDARRQFDERLELLSVNAALGYSEARMLKSFSHLRAG
jgi:NTE family protein